MHMRTTYRYSKLTIKSQIILTKNMEYKRAVNGRHVGTESILLTVTWLGTLEVRFR